MSFTPTKEQLEELGMIWNYKLDLYSNGIISAKLWEWNPPHEEWKFFIGGEVEANIQSLEDLKTLIRILTPQ